MTQENYPISVVPRWCFFTHVIPSVPKNHIRIVNERSTPINIIIADTQSLINMRFYTVQANNDRDISVLGMSKIYITIYDRDETVCDVIDNNSFYCVNREILQRHQILIKHDDTTISQVNVDNFLHNIKY
jgi:hypothetical protein